MFLFIDVQHRYVTDYPLADVVESRLRTARRIGDMADRLRAAGHQLCWINTGEPGESPFTAQGGFCEVTPGARDLVGLKHHVSAMDSGDLPRIIERVRPAQIILGGFFFDRCVARTAHALRHRMPELPLGLLTPCTHAGMISVMEREFTESMYRKNNVALIDAPDMLLPAAPALTLPARAP